MSNQGAEGDLKNPDLVLTEDGKSEGGMSWWVNENVSAKGEKRDGNKKRVKHRGEGDQGPTRTEG